MEKKKVKKVEGVRPKKRLGQHFLRDKSIIDEIISLSGFSRDDQLIEIGGGTGALTLPLSEYVGQIFTIEKDSGLAEMLENDIKSSGIKNITVIKADILKLDFDEIPLISGKRVNLIGNLPYNISSPLLERLLNNSHRFERAIFMFQAEFGRRLAASPGIKAYGAMTVMVQYCAAIRSLIEVPKEAFYPIPKVESIVLEIDFNRPYPKRADDEEKFRKVVKGAFALRRKNLLNALRGAFPLCSSQEIREALDRCSIDPGRRAETLSMDDFLCLSSAFGHLLDKQNSQC